MEVSKYLRNHSRTIKGKRQLILDGYARALEIIPRQLCDNAGFDSTDILNKLRMRHARGETWAGVDIKSEGIADNFEKFVWEPTLVKTNVIKSATEAAIVIISIDETIKAEQSQQPQAGPQMSKGQAQQVLRGMGRGRGMPR
jgi:T-complex protein 1 subunit eta